jgi:branched-subunit amino acid transport protein AzlD
MPVGVMVILAAYTLRDITVPTSRRNYRQARRLVKV